MLAATCLLTAAPGSARAQGAALRMTLGASHSLPPAGGAGVPSTYLNGGLHVVGPIGDGFVRVGASGGLAVTEDGASWLSGIAALGGRHFLSDVLSIGLVVTGEAFTVGAPTPYRAAYAQAEPDVMLSWTAASVRLNAYGALGSSEVTTIRTFVRDTRFGRRVYTVGFPVVTDLWAWGGGVEFRHGAGVVAPALGFEAYDSPQGRYLMGRAGVEARSAAGVFVLEAYLWDTPDGSEPAFLAGVRVPTGPGADAVASGGRFGPDPLLDAPAAGGAALSMDMELAGPARSPDFSWALGEGPTVTLELRAPNATRVECVGDLTDWRRAAMVRSGSSWRITLSVEPGVYHFGFFVDDEWFVPGTAPGRAEDDWGRIQATLVVTEQDLEAL